MRGVLLYGGSSMSTTADILTVVTPADWVSGPPQGRWTYKDYASLSDDGQPYEIMAGVLLVTPSRSPAHQYSSGKFFRYLAQYVDDIGRGKVFYAPLDVELTPYRVFQPDLIVLLNESLGKITASRVVGAPDLVIEITSPGTATYDRLNKFEAYAQAGIGEYWIVNPKTDSVEVLWLQVNTYLSQGIFKGDDRLPSRVVPEISNVSVKQFFQ
jgi:Uma2 family endonuclease